jgi:hypothetical protein
MGRTMVMMSLAATLASAGLDAVGSAAQGKGHGGGNDHAQARGQGGGNDHAQARGQGGGNRARAARPSPARQAEPRGRGQQTQRAQRGGGQADRVRAARPSRASGSPDRGRSEARGAGTTGRAAERGSAERGRSASRSGPSGARIFGAALERGRGRGLRTPELRVANVGNRVRLLNRRGDVLLDMEDDRVREMGAWRLRRMGDRRPTSGAPAFCRSGAGHPVWGREWCLDKGFGLGSGAGTLWSRGRVDDVVFRGYPERLDRGGLLDVLGDIVLGRVALQAVTLGFDQPLVGVWMAPPSGQRSLVVQSGGYPVAEFVDLDRDDRVEVLYVIQPM